MHSCGVLLSGCDRPSQTSLSHFSLSRLVAPLPGPLPPTDQPTPPMPGVYFSVSFHAQDWHVPPSAGFVLLAWKTLLSGQWLQALIFGSQTVEPVQSET